jgi:hypothetical protein
MNLFQKIVNEPIEWIRSFAESTFIQAVVTAVVATIVAGLGVIFSAIFAISALSELESAFERMVGARGLSNLFLRLEEVLLDLFGFEL